MVSSSEILSWLGQTALAMGGALGLFLIALPTKFGDKLIGHRFDKKLAAFKDAQDQQIEKLKEQLAHASDRGKRSNEREYEALSDIWGQFVDAFQATEQCVVQFIEHPDFTRMSDEEIDTFLNATDFSDDQKREFKSSSDQNRLYSRTIAWKSITRAHNLIFETRVALKKRGIFVPEALRKVYEEAIELCSKAEIHEFVKFRNPTIPYADDAPMKYFAEKDVMFKTVMDATSARLLRTPEGG